MFLAFVFTPSINVEVQIRVLILLSLKESMSIELIERGSFP